MRTRNFYDSTFCCLVLATVLGAVEAQPAHAYGELSLLPSYYTKSGKLDPLRAGLYIQEDLSTKFYYSSWTGSGKVFLDDASISDVRWITTQQDLNYAANSIFKIGGGAGFNYSHPTANKEFDVHLKAAVKLW